MSDPFAGPIELTPDPRVRHIRVKPGPVSDQDEQSAPDPGVRSSVRQVPGWLAAALAEQSWYSQPQLALTVLVEHARHGEWTVRYWRRTARLVWLWGPAVIGRALAWGGQRIWLRDQAPPFGACQPPLAELADRMRSGSRRDIALGVPAIGLRVVSYWADSGARSAVAGAIAWLLANWANNVPGLHVVVPDAVTAEVWWRTTESAVARVAHAASSVATAAGSAVSGLVAAAAICGLLYVVVRKTGESQ